MDDGAIERVHSTVAKHVTNSVCPFCGTEDWTPMTGLIGLMVAEFDADARPRDDEDVMLRFPTEMQGIRIVREGAVAWQCGSCGFVRVHAVAPESFEAH
ncbi:MAG: hypothetical protein ABR972_15125 [Acidimicrobiales bacterium]|jgi:predicted RNA-binding Zn-ribbon protein involved in translation (DUF1610 family)